MIRSRLRAKTSLCRDKRIDWDKIAKMHPVNRKRVLEGRDPPPLKRGKGGANPGKLIEG